MHSQSKQRPGAEFGFRVSSAHSKHNAAHLHVRPNADRPLLVMKFGGTSVADAMRIEKAAEIIEAAALHSQVVVVVSAMSGVTNRLLEAAAESQAGNSHAVDGILRELQLRHEQVAEALIRASALRELVRQQMRELFREAQASCQDAIANTRLTPQVRDSIASLGERLSAPLVASALNERGLASEAVVATETIVTDANYGAADPDMAATRERCRARMRPLLQQGVVPVLTGFLGATRGGLLTTLGRGGSDYSATILGAALDADEVIIWTDVDGVLTADPRMVREACTIPEISYREAADLALFGAKVLHPKTLRPVMQSDIPVWIRNSFAPEHPGTKITPAGTANRDEPKAVTAISEARMITLSGGGTAEVRDLLGRATAAVSAVRADAWLTVQSGSRREISIAVSPASADQAAQALLGEFVEELAQGKLDRVVLGAEVAIVTLVGQGLRNLLEIRERALAALDRAEIEIVAIGETSSDDYLSFLVTPTEVNQALVVLHQEFRLGQLDLQALPVKVL
jgi:bifunctional aspartokinase / homoserine dehydrogenase 1